MRDTVDVATAEPFVVFLRAINTGRRRLTNDELLAPFVTAGFDDVTAYQAAGNIVMRSDPAQLPQTEQLDPLLAHAYGFDAPSFVRSFVELRALVDEQPFSDRELEATDGRIQVALLRNKTTPSTLDAVAQVIPAEDLVMIRGDVLYWLPKEGISGSQLPVKAIEKLLGPMTIRTLGTIERLLTKFGD